jgi:hypothetical protein
VSIQEFSQAGNLGKLRHGSPELHGKAGSGTLGRGLRLCMFCHGSHHVRILVERPGSCAYTFSGGLFCRPR